MNSKLLFGKAKTFRCHRNHRPDYVTDPDKVYFKPALPLELKDRVIGRGSGRKKTPCVGELIEMVDCLKRTGFNDAPCKRPIEAFINCNNEFKETAKLKQKQAQGDIALVSSTKDMDRYQLNSLLKYFSPKKKQ